MTKRIVLFVCMLTALGTWQADAQVGTLVPPVVSNAKPVRTETIKIHGKSLEGSLEGDSADRDVIVYLPPSYDKDKKRRYPVVYALHGYSIGAEQWSKEIHVPQTIEGGFAQGAQDMIVVLPDAKTVHNGSMYSSSVTTGNFERFIAEDVVLYIDAHYRTLPTRASRGLVGHSMGGYGASRRRHEACRRLRQPVHDESVLHVCPEARTVQPRDGQDAGSSQDAGGLREAALWRACPACFRGSLVAQPEEPSALP
ncbi:MAG: alpha/beta hydrolase [Janthinobacterium lividum]